MFLHVVLGALVIKDFLFWVVKSLFQMVLWVYILSISWSHQTLFERAQEVLVRNQVVGVITDEIVQTYDRTMKSVRLNLVHLSSEKDKLE